MCSAQCALAITITNNSCSLLGMKFILYSIKTKSWSNLPSFYHHPLYKQKSISKNTRVKNKKNRTVNQFPPYFWKGLKVRWYEILNYMKIILLISIKKVLNLESSMFLVHYFNMCLFWKLQMHLLNFKWT